MLVKKLSAFALRKAFCEPLYMKQEEIQVKCTL